MYKKLLLAIVLIFIVIFHAEAQNDTVKYWKKGGFASFTFNQVSLSNWVAGGENALSATALLNLFANYKKDKIVWDNSLDLGYGLMKIEGKGQRKNEDKIDLLSKVGYEAFGKFYYSALFNYRTQFTDGYQYPNDTTQILVSRFNAPAYLSFSLGLDYKPNEYFSLFFSPLTGKVTLVMDNSLSNAGMYGVTPGKKARGEFGAGLNIKFQKDVIKNVNVLSKLTMFNNYTDKDKSNRANFDVNWEVMVNIKANKFLTTSIFTNLIYDQNIIRKTQFKEVFGLGVSYKF
jgi:hypothetical protein